MDPSPPGPRRQIRRSRQSKESIAKSEQSRSFLKRFLLRVADDRTLEIIPRAAYVTTDAAILKTLKSSYTSAIKVTIAGRAEPITTAQKLTLTVKKTTPKITA